MKNNHVLSPLRQSLRQFNKNGINFHLDRLTKKANDPNCALPLRAEIHLEVVKALRVTDRLPEAVRLADLAIANIPADCLDVLSALKRIRALMYLDYNDYVSAQNLIDGTDGLELILEGGRSLVTRSDAEVEVETWLVSVEIALAMRDLKLADECFNKAVNRLSIEEAALRRKRINPMEKKSLEQFYHDLGQMLSLYGLTISLLHNDSYSRAGLAELCEQVEGENNIAAAARKLPNVPLHSKLLCLLREWLPDADNPPAGLSLLEARRWASFAAPASGATVSPRPAAEAGELSPPPSALTLLTSEAPSDSLALETVAVENYRSTALDTAPGDPTARALSITASALEKMAQVLQQFETILPNVQSYLKNGDSPADYSARGFSGHLMDTDLYNFMQNFSALQFNGFLQLKWDKDLYKTPIIKGILPELVRSGEAHIYVVGGIAVDAVFAGQTEAHTLERAQENFLTLTRMCLCIGTDDVRADILGNAVPLDAVRERTPLLNVRVNDLLHITADIESELAGLKSGEDDSPTDVLSDSTTPAPPAETANENSFTDLNETDISSVAAVAEIDLLSTETALPPANADTKKPLDLNQTAVDAEDLLELV